MLSAGEIMSALSAKINPTKSYQLHFVELFFTCQKSVREQLAQTQVLKTLRYDL